MSKKSPPSPPLVVTGPLMEAVTGKFYCVGKSDHLLYEAFEITVLKGMVTAVKVLSRAPDMEGNAVAACTRELWVNARTQKGVHANA